MEALSSGASSSADVEMDLPPRGTDSGARSGRVQHQGAAESVSAHGHRPCAVFSPGPVSRA